MNVNVFDQSKLRLKCTTMTVKNNAQKDLNYAEIVIFQKADTVFEKLDRRLADFFC